MTKASEKRIDYRIGARKESTSRSRVVPVFHFDHRRVRDKVNAAEPARELTASDLRDLAAAQAKRERKAARGIHGS